MPVVIKGSGTVEGIAVGGLPDGIVDTDMIATNAVVTAKIAAGTIATADIADAAITAPKIVGAGVTLGALNSNTSRYFYAWRNDSSNQGVTSDTITKVEYDSVRQSDSAFSTTDNKFTATTDDVGAWLFISQISFYTDGNDGNNCFVKIYKNGSQVAGGYNWIWRSTNYLGHFVGTTQTVEVIAKDDYIESYARIAGGNNEAFFGGDSSGGHKQTSLVGFKI